MRAHQGAGVGARLINQMGRGISSGSLCRKRRAEEQISSAPSRMIIISRRAISSNSSLAHVLRRGVASNYQIASNGNYLKSEEIYGGMRGPGMVKLKWPWRTSKAIPKSEIADVHEVREMTLAQRCSSKY